MLTQLETMITEYVALAAELKRKVPGISAIMGNKEDVMHPAHREFYDGICTWVAKFSATGPDQENLTRALEVLLLSAGKYDKTAACWYLVAIQSHAKPLIPMLEESNRELLRQRYDAAYPRSKRLPLQQEMYQLLGGKRKKLFGLL